MEGDFLAGQAFELGDELALAAQRGRAVMPVGAQVGEVAVGVGEQVPGDGEDGVADRDQGALLAAAPGDPLVAGGQEGLGAGALVTASPMVPPSQGLPVPVPVLAVLLRPAILVVNSRSCGEAEFEACQVAGSLPV